MKFSKLDNILIGFFVLIFISSIYLLTTQNNQAASVKEAGSIGTIIKIKNKVKKRRNSMITWHNALESDAIQEDDVIFTSEHSQALLKFRDGSILSIEGDSLVRLKDYKDSIEIVLEKGDLQINNQNEMKVGLSLKEGQNLAISKNAIFQLSKRLDKTEINSISGEANLVTQTNNKFIENGQNLNISGNKITKFNSVITINEARIENKNIHLEWSSENKFKNFTILIAEDFTFSVPLEIKSTVTSQKIPWEGPVAYIKISAVDDKQNIIQSQVRKIYILKTKIDQISQSNDQDLLTNILNLYKKMLKNSNNLKK